MIPTRGPFDWLAELEPAGADWLIGCGGLDLADGEGGGDEDLGLALGDVLEADEEVALAVCLLAWPPPVAEDAFVKEARDLLDVVDFMGFMTVG